MPDLHDYQIVAREFLRGRPQAGLFLDMGLGKTAATLSALEPRHLPVLVVAPKKVAENVWDAEVDIWRPDLSVRLAVGEPEDRHAALASGADIVVLGRDNLKDVAQVFRGGVRHPLPFKTIVIDELSGFKTRASVRWKTMRKITQQPSVEFVWGLTGTPSPNGMMDLWAQIGLLDGGERLGRNITTYRSRYFVPDLILPSGVVASYRIQEDAQPKIMAKIEDICLAMTGTGRIKLPPVSYPDHVIPLPARVRKVYAEMSKDLVVDLEDIFGGQVHTASNAAVLTSKLSQIAAGFIFEDPTFVEDPERPGEYIHANEGDYTWLHDDSVNAVKEIVDAIDSPVIVFYRFQPEAEALKRVLGPGVHTTDEPDLQRRWNKGEFPVLLAHPASAGHGLNLQHGGHHIVWASPTWNLEEWEQGNKRLLRQGQKHPVVIHSIIRDKTIDRLIRRRLDGKAEVQADLMNYLESPV